MFKLAPFVLPPLTTVRVSQSELVRIAFHAFANAHELEGNSFTVFKLTPE